MKPQPPGEQSSSLAPACITQTVCFIPSEILSSEEMNKGIAKTRALLSDSRECHSGVMLVEFSLLTVTQGQTRVVTVIASLP